MQAADAPRARRFAKACDHCYRKKIKCHIAPSPSGGQACKECEKHDQLCTFTRAKRDLKKPRRTARQLAVVSDRLEQVEALLAEERAKATTHREASDVGNVPTEQAGQQTANGEGHVQPLNNASTAHVHLSDSELALVELYFDHCNLVFPIFSKYAFLTSILRHSFRTAADEEGAAVRSSASAMLSLALRVHALSESENAPSGEDRASAYLERAVGELNTLVLARPSMVTVQALLVTVCAMLASPDPATRASVVLAVAVRHAQSLDMHLLDTLVGISGAERLERIRIFWCLYILDKELGLRLGTPSLLSDDDRCVLEPRESSDDGIGLVSSDDGDTRVNVFTARQRLARIQSSVHARLHTFKARHAPKPEKARVVEEWNVALQKWQAAWLSDERVLAQGTWPSWALIHVVRLHFAYFHTLLLANPLVPSDEVAISSKLREMTLEGFGANEVFIRPPLTLAHGARATFTAAGLVRHGGLSWPMEALRFVLPAVLIILQSTIADPYAESAHADFKRAETWIGAFELLRSRGTVSDNTQESAVTPQLRKLAEQALQTAGV